MTSCVQCANDTSSSGIKTLTSITRATKFVICKTEGVSLGVNCFMAPTTSLGEKASCVLVFRSNRRLLSREITARAADRRCEEGVKEVPGWGDGLSSFSRMLASVLILVVTVAHTRKHARARTKCAYRATAGFHNLLH